MEKCKCWVASRPQIGRSSSKAHRRSTLRSSKAQEKHCAQQLTALNMQAVPSAHDPTHFAYDSDICKPGFFVDASNVIRGGSVKQQIGGVYQPQMCNVSILKMQSRRIKFDLEDSVNQMCNVGDLEWTLACTTLQLIWTRNKHYLYFLQISLDFGYFQQIFCTNRDPICLEFISQYLRIATFLNLC